jgi:hypothetical protein
MSDTSSISDWRVKDLIASIDSDQVAPGAGAAGAVTLALAAACAGKAISISLKHHPAKTALQDALACCTEIARHALAGADRDAEAFKNFIRARSAAAAARLVDAGEELAHWIDALSAVIDSVEAQIVPGVAGDIAAARALAAAARSIQARNEADAQSSLAPPATLPNR